MVEQLSEASEISKAAQRIADSLANTQSSPGFKPIVFAKDDRQRGLQAVLSTEGLVMGTGTEVLLVSDKALKVLGEKNIPYEKYYDPGKK